MTPEDKKLITVMTKLYARTKADVVDWEPNQDANIFGVKFSDYTISLVRILATPTHAEWFNLSIANSDGAVIQRWTVQPQGTTASPTCRTFSIAPDGARWI